MNIQVKKRIPVLSTQQLTYDIYDLQRDIMRRMEPKRFECHANISIRGIRNLMSYLGEDNWTFDGMDREAATMHYQVQAAHSGIIQPYLIPLVLAKRIECVNPHFINAAVVIETDEQGFRVVKRNILQECATMLTRRSIFSNVAYALHLRYGVNLHLTNRDVRNAISVLGQWEGQEPLRYMFEEACKYYTQPNSLTPNDFLRCMIPDFRKCSDEFINAEVTHVLQGTSVKDESYKQNILRSIDVYEGRLINWYGDLT